MQSQRSNALNWDTPSAHVTYFYLLRSLNISIKEISIAASTAQQPQPRNLNCIF